jgi:hypothetical protein
VFGILHRTMSGHSWISSHSIVTGNSPDTEEERALKVTLADGLMELLQKFSELSAWEILESQEQARHH